MLLYMPQTPCNAQVSSITKNYPSPDAWSAESEKLCILRCSPLLSFKFRPSSQSLRKWNCRVARAQLKSDGSVLIRQR